MIELVQHVLYHAPSSVRGAERVLLLAIAQETRRRGEPRSIPVSDLALALGVPERQVREVAARLLKEGIEVRVPLGLDRHNKPLYTKQGLVPTWILPELPVPADCQCPVCRRPATAGAASAAPRDESDEKRQVAAGAVNTAPVDVENKEVQVTPGAVSTAPPKVGAVFPSPGAVFTAAGDVNTAPSPYSVSVNPPPSPPTDPPPASPGAGGGGEEDPDLKERKSKIVAAVRGTRRYWPYRKILQTIDKALEEGYPIELIEVAFPLVAADAQTDYPGRLLTGGPWWKTAEAQLNRATPPPAAASATRDPDQEWCSIHPEWPGPTARGTILCVPCKKAAAAQAAASPPAAPAPQESATPLADVISLLERRVS